MVKIVFTPDWFLNFDVLIGLFSFAILAAFFLFAIKSYKISKKKSVLYLGIGFLLIALAELGSVFTKLVLYYDTGVTKEIGKVIVTQGIVGSVDIFYYLGFFLQRLLTLLGLYAIYRVSTGRKPSAPADLVLSIYLLLMTAILSHTMYYFYHLTAFILLALIIRDYRRIYLEEKVPNTFILMVAFALLAVSQIEFIFSNVAIVYVAAQSLQVVSYLILLFLIVKIVIRGKQK